MNAIWTTVQRELKEIQNSGKGVIEQDRESRKRQGVHHNYIIYTTIYDIHHIYRIYITITGYTPQLKDAHHIYRVCTTTTGCTP